MSTGQIPFQWCGLHKKEYANFMGNMKCPDCNWEQQITKNSIENYASLGLCKHGVNPAMQQCYYCGIEHRLNKLESEIKSHWKLLSDIMPKLDRKPHKCPVCEGRGNLQKEVEPKILKFTLCTSCEGKGIVWG